MKEFGVRSRFNCYLLDGYDSSIGHFLQTGFGLSAAALFSQTSASAASAEQLSVTNALQKSAILLVNVAFEAQPELD